VERKARYLDKLAHVDKRIANVREWLPQALEDEKTKLAVYKAFQEAVEALLDIAAMKLANLSIPPKDDYTNLKELHTLGLLKAEHLNTMRKANGLRNRLIHSYNTLSDEVAIKSIHELLPELVEVRRIMEAWI